MNRFRDKFANFMSGRYGNDQFNRFLSFATIILLIIGIVVRERLLTFIAIALIIYTYFRTFSRNYAARAEENERYLAVKGRIITFFKVQKKNLTDRQYKYFVCPSCKKQLRVPKGKGNISVRCPMCGRTFTKRT